MEERRALIELLERDGSVHARYPVAQWPVRIGRGFDCEVVLDDPHVAAVHAQIGPDAEGRLAVTACASRNGVRLGARKLAEGETAPLPAGALLTLGQSRLRVRLAGETLAPERLLAKTGRPALVTVALLAALVLLVQIGEQWLLLDPGEKLSTLLTPLVGVPVGLVLWAMCWGLGSKLFQRHFVFLPHLGYALWFVLAASALDFGLHGLAFASGWAWPSRIANWAQLAAAALLVHAHLGLLLPTLRRTGAIGVAVVYAAALAVSVGLTWQHQNRPFQELYTATLGPPALRLAPAVPVERFIAETAPLEASLQRHAREDEPDDSGDAADDGRDDDGAD